MIFSKSYCPHCAQAKALFAKLGAQISVIELDRTKEGPAYPQPVLLKVTGKRTVPSIFGGGQHIGGNDDVQARVGELQTIVKILAFK